MHASRPSSIVYEVASFVLLVLGSVCDGAVGVHRSVVQTSVFKYRSCLTGAGACCSAVVLGVESFVIATPPTSLSGTTSFVSAVNIYYTPDFVAAAVKSA